MKANNVEGSDEEGLLQYMPFSLYLLSLGIGFLNIALLFLSASISVRLNGITVLAGIAFIISCRSMLRYGVLVEVCGEDDVWSSHGFHFSFAIACMSVFFVLFSDAIETQFLEKGASLRSVFLLLAYALQSLSVVFMLWQATYGIVRYSKCVILEKRTDERRGK